MCKQLKGSVFKSLKLKRFEPKSVKKLARTGPGPAWTEISISLQVWAGAGSRILSLHKAGPGLEKYVSCRSLAWSKNTEQNEKKKIWRIAATFCPFCASILRCVQCVQGVKQSTKHPMKNLLQKFVIRTNRLGIGHAFSMIIKFWTIGIIYILKF